MPKKKPEKAELLQALAEHVLEHGLNTASLRPMAAAANTSDRMLIYYFGSKENLISDLLTHLAAQMATGLDAAIPARRVANEAELLNTVCELMRSDAFAPYVRVWLDILSAAGQGSDAHRQTGGEIIDIFIAWLALRLPGGADAAPAALIKIEGALVLDAVGRTQITDQALARG